MADEFSINMMALHSENLSPAAERGGWLHQQVDDRIAYRHAGYEMSRVESVAKSLSISATISEERETRTFGSNFGGGPVIDYSTILHIGGALTAAAALLKAARPILIEIIKTRRTSFEFKHGDFSVKVESPDDLEKIEAYAEKLLNRARESGDPDKPGSDEEPGAGGDQPFSE